MTSTSPKSSTRNTRQLDEVRQIMLATDAFLTAQEVHEALRGQASTIGLATVYRRLQALAEAGEMDTIRTPDGQTAYRRCSNTHHHHLICRECGRTEEIENPTVEAWLATLADTHGFTEIDHAIELYGRCSNC